MARVLAGEVPPPSSIATALPSSLDGIVMRGLEREPGNRYATAREMAQELDATFGVASAAEIGDWVERVAAQELEERAKRIADIERGASEDDVETSVRIPTSPGREAPDAPTPVGLRAPEETTARKPSAPGKGGQGTWLAVGIGATALVLLVAVIVAVTRSASPKPPAQPPVISAAASSSSTPPASADEPLPTPAEPTASETAPSASPTPTQTARQTPTATGPHPLPARTAHPADCNPPYTTDAKGHVHFKPQCM
jgi:serine/threonine-protein kinase